MAWLKTCRGLGLAIEVKPEGRKGCSVLPRRWVVERTFAWPGKQRRLSSGVCPAAFVQRRLSKGYEEKPATSEAFIHIAMTALMVRRLAPA